uniref:Uncharacterized protein n=1 Tax=Glossina brevipalpis TaxID=37001 RepID=A0A1A9WLG9_9MUSC
MKHIKSWKRNLLLITAILSTGKAVCAIKLSQIKPQIIETNITIASGANSDRILTNVDDNEILESTSVQLADDHDDDNHDDDDESILSTAWNVMRRMWHWIKNDLSKSLWHNQSNISSTDVGDGRTFGKIRRLQMALIPLAFKFGVLFTMVAFLVMLGMKTLFLVKTLVLINATALLAKFLTLKFPQTQEHYLTSSSAYGWSPHSQTGWPALGSLHHGKEIHLHIHGGNVDTLSPQISPYSVNGINHRPGWERKLETFNEPNEQKIPLNLKQIYK